MYGSGRGLGLASGTGGLGAVFAATGFPVVGVSLLALAFVLLGLVLVGVAKGRRTDSAS